MRSLINSCRHHLSNFSDSFHGMLSLRISGADYAIAGTIFLVSLIVFLRLAPDALLGGDTAVYAWQIEQADFSERTLHLGYYLLGALFKPFLSFDDAYSINAMSCVFGALCLSLLFLISKVVFGDRKSGMVSCVLLLTNYGFLRNSFFGEIYIVQIFFALMAVMMWLQRKSSLAGLFLVMGFLVSPSVMFIVPGLILLWPRVKSIIALSIWSFAAAVVLILLHEHDYLYGVRGVLAASRYSMSWLEILAKESSEIFFGFLFAIPLMIGGAVGAIRGKQRLFFTSVALIFLVIFLFGERVSDVPAQLISILLLNLFCGYGFIRLLDKGENEKSPDLFWVLLGSLGIATTYFASLRLTGGLISTNLIAFFIAFLLLYLSMMVARQRFIEVRAGVVRFALYVMLFVMVVGNGVKASVDLQRTIHRTVDFKSRVLLMDEVCASDCLVVASWGQAVLYEYYVHGRPDTGRWIDERSLARQVPGCEKKVFVRHWRMKQAMAEGREIWLFERYSSVIGQLQAEGYEVSKAHGFYRAQRMEPPRGSF